MNILNGLLSKYATYVTKLSFSLFVTKSETCNFFFWLLLLVA